MLRGILLEQGRAPLAARSIVGIEREVQWTFLVGRPVEQDFIALFILFFRIRVQQPDDGRFQPFRFVHRVDAHRVAGRTELAFVRRLVAAVAHFAQFLQEPRQAGITPGVHSERDFHEGMQVGADFGAHLGR